MKTIYFVRHALTEANVAGIAAGGEFETELTKEGRSQAKRAGQDLKDKQIQLIVCSPLIRTVDTAKIIAKEIGYDYREIVTNPLFIERKLGIYSGRPHTEYREAGMSGMLDKSVESTEALFERVAEGLQWLQTFDAQNIVVVSHGATGKAVRLINEGLSSDHYYKIDGFGNTEIYEFSL